METVSDAQLVLALQSQAADYANDQPTLLIVLEELVSRLASSAGLEQWPQDTAADLLDAIFLRLRTAQLPATIDLLLAVLTNASISEPSTQLVLANIAARNAGSFRFLLERFLDYYPQAEAADCQDWTAADPWGCASNLLCHLSRLEAGRDLVSGRERCHLPRLVPQMRSKNIARRRGAVATVRTLLFFPEAHRWALGELNILPHLLYPLVVSKAFTEEEKLGMDPIVWMQALNPSKLPEQDEDILRMLLECLLLLCQEQDSRAVLRRKKVYPVCRNLDEAIESEAASNVIYEIVNLLMRDEEGEGQQQPEPQVQELSEAEAEAEAAAAAAAAN